MAVPSHAEIMKKVREGTLIEAIFKRHWDCWPSEYGPYTDTLSEIHNQGHLDLAEGLSSDFLSHYPGHSKLIGRMVYASLLGKLNIPFAPLLDVIERLYDPVDDWRDISKILGSWCHKRRDRIEQVFEFVDQCDERYEKLQTLKAAISEAVQFEAEHHAERIYAYLVHPNQSYRLQAIEGLRHASFKKEQGWQNTIDVFRTVIGHDRSDDLRASLIDAVVCWFEVAPPAVHSAMQSFILETAEPPTPAVTSKIAWTLAHNSGHLKQRLWDSMLKVSQDAPLQAGDCSNLDFFLERLIKAGGVARAQDFLQHLLLKDGGKSEHRLSHFQSVVQVLLKGQPAILTAWVFNWLKIGDHRLCSELNNALFLGLEEPHQFTFEGTPFTFEPKEYGFIARKAIGHFFHHPVSLAALLILLGSSAPPQQRAEVRDLLFDPVLINYPNIAKGCLATVANGNGCASSLIREATDLLDDYLKGIREAPLLHELKPPALHRQMEFERYSDQIQQALDEGRKDSFLADLFRERTLLYGNGVVSLAPVDGELHPFETEATVFSHKLELPRQYLFEPVSLRKMLFHYKMEIRS